MNSRVLYVLSVFFLLFGGSLWAQKSKFQLRKATEAYHSGRYVDANEIFAKVKGEAQLETLAKFGRATTLYKQGKMEEATKLYEELLTSSDSLDSDQTAQILHNLGNISMKAKAYDQAIELYQDALIANPHDEDTRYNLVLAQKLRKRDDNNQGGGGGEQENPQNNQQKQQQNNDNSSGSKQNQGEQSESMTREQIQRMLDAYKQEDNAVRQRAEQVIRQMQRNDAANNSKNW